MDIDRLRAEETPTETSHLLAGRSDKRPDQSNSKANDATDKRIHAPETSRA